MRKTVELSLNKFAVIPNSLRTNAAANAPVDCVEIDLARLYHHYYLDTRGYAPPNPDPAQFEHLTLLLPDPDLRVRGSGFGINPAFRQHVSNELGQAFCRWFLYEHLNITYFAHMASILGRPLHPAFGGVTVERFQRGDTPDYFCAEDSSKIFLAEAKGRSTSVSFANAEFGSWRKQFARVLVRDASGTPRSVKGYIAATRFATERMRSSTRSKLFVEDPQSPGEAPLREPEGIGQAVVALHYADIAAKLRQPILSAALATGVQVPAEILFPAVVWEFQIPPLEKKRFVGGYFPGSDGVAPIQLDGGKVVFLPSNPFRLDVAHGTFFGVEEGIFRSMCAMTRAGDVAAARLDPLPDVLPFYSGISFLRDGSIIGPLEFFSPVGQTTF